MMIRRSISTKIVVLSLFAMVINNFRIMNDAVLSTLPEMKSNEAFLFTRPYNQDVTRNIGLQNDAAASIISLSAKKDVRNLISKAHRISSQYGFLFFMMLNHANLDMTLSWICQARMLNVLPRTLFVATDHLSYEALQEQLDVNIFHAESKSNHQAMNYGQRDYFDFVLFRANIVMHMLEANIAVWIVEADSTWFGDPSSLLKPNLDVMAGQNGLIGQSVLQAGFIYLNPTPATRSLWANLIWDHKNHLQKTHTNEVDGDEMNRLNTMLHDPKYSNVNWEVFNNTYSVSGLWYRDESMRQQTEPLVIQNNWIIGVNAKIKRAKEWNHWFLNEDLGECTPQDTFRIIVLTKNRPKSLERLLASIQATNYSNDVVSVDIRIDGSHKETRRVSDAWLWKHKSVTETHAGGLRGAWLGAWVSPGMGTHAIIFEDDVEVAPDWYQWVAQAWKAYGKRSDLAGISIMRQVLVPTNPSKQMEIVNDHEPFLYKLVGSIGFSPHPLRWQEFLEWIKTKDLDTFDAHVDGLVTSDWYNAMEKKTMWTQLFIRFCHERDLYTLYVNLPENRTLGAHWREKGEHHIGNQGIDFDLATSPISYSFPINVHRYGWDGILEEADS